MAVQAQLCPESLCLPMCGMQDCMVNNPVSVSGLQADLCITYRQHPFPQQNHFLNRGSQSYGLDCTVGPSSSSSSTCDSFFPMALSQSLDAILELHRREVDCILQLQSERLRSALQEQRKHQLSILIRSVESKALFLMRQKENDLAQATKRNMKYEACLKKAHKDRESWQQIAREKEAIILDIKKALEQTRESMVLANNRAQDAESFCCGSSEREQDKNQTAIGCKNCNSRSSCVVFFPCRHLCSCNFCEAFLGFCPVCHSVKEASMEVYLV